MACDKEQTFGSTVATACLDQYSRLPKRGKPQSGKEWTCLAAFVETSGPTALEIRDPAAYKVVSLATGTKCLGQSERSLQGNVVNDSHAEVLARRVLLRYFYRQLADFLEGKDSIFCYTERKGITVKENIKYHMYISHTPCGDASIFPKLTSNIGNCKKDNILSVKESCHRNKHKISAPHPGEPVRKKVDLSCFHRVDSVGRAVDEPVLGNPAVLISNSNDVKSESTLENCKKHTTLEEVAFTLPDSQLERDIYRTGAKCVPGGKQDPYLLGENYHTVCALRIKPGRGDRTLSMSCSDKIMKWCALGLQGGMLSTFLDGPIVLSSIVLGKCPFSREALDRAFSLRNRENSKKPQQNYNYHRPDIYLSSELFPDGKDSHVGTVNPVGSAIIWCNYPPLLEIICNGRRQGVTKSKWHLPQARVSVCKMNLLGCYLSVLKHWKKTESNAREESSLLTYGEVKIGSESYNKARTNFFSVFPDWVSKPPNESNFCSAPTSP